MKLTREIVLDELINALQEAQQDIVEEPEQIDEDTIPIGDLGDFDSLTSVEVTVSCLDNLGFDEFPSFPTLFINKKNEALAVGQVADRILKLRLKRH